MDNDGGFHKDAKEIIASLEDAGVVFRLSSKGHAIGQAPYGLGSTSVPRKFTGRGRANCQAQADRMLKRIKDHEAAFAPTPHWDPEPEPVPTLGPPEPVVTMERPWMARQGATADKGRHYASRAVVERRWSDGSTDYVCAKPGCGYTNAKPHSVRSHWARSKDHVDLGTRVAKARGPLEIGPAYEPHHRPTPDRVAAILALLAQRPNVGTDLPLDELVAEILSADMERDPLYERGALGVVPAGPMTDEQILDAIRGLVGGTTQAEVEDLRRQLSDAHEAVARLTEERQALRELLA